MLLDRVDAYLALYIPRLAQLHVCDAIFLAKSELYLAECIKSSPVEADLLLQRLLDKLALINGYLSFTRHVASSQSGMGACCRGRHELFAGTENAAGTEKRGGATC
jgi:hypothetical protein